MFAVALFIAAFLPALVGCNGADEGPPDLLLITIDTLRADRLACYGGEPDVGEAICALAEGGTRFAWAFSTAPATSASVASLLTSLYPAFHGVDQGAHIYLSNAALSVAEVLRSADYTTAAVVSNPILERGRNFIQGFDTYDEPGGWIEREAQGTTDAALGWIQSDARPPWFLWVHYIDPHGPYAPPRAPEESDDPQDARLPVLSNDYAPGGIPAYQALPGIHTLAAYERRYAAEIRHLDGEIERLIEGIEAFGRAPAILLTSDHGEAFGEDGYYLAHGHSVGLDQIRVPLLWRSPRSTQARVVETPVSLVDIAPTLVRLAGLDVPDAFQGEPLPLSGLPMAGFTGRRRIFAEQNRRVAVIDGRTFYEANRREQQTGPHPHLPERLAVLRGTDLLPAYAPAGEKTDSRELKGALETYIDSTRDLPAAPRHTHVSEEVRERLRALGYTE